MEQMTDRLEALGLRHVLGPQYRSRQSLQRALGQHA